MTRLRYRLARWLVGPFVTLPDRPGVFVVQRFGQGTSATFEADKYRFRSGMTLHGQKYRMKDYLDLNGTRKWGRFVGTVKYR